MKNYKTALGESVFTQSILKSKFIAYLSHAESEQQAVDFINSIRKKHSDATHNCYAYTLLKNNIGRSSDDGEPSGTAGKPIYEVIKGEQLFDTVIVVTRYFGGTLLGTGGLVRAYGSSAKGVLNQSQIVTMEETELHRVIIDYKFLDPINRLIEKNADVKTADTIYGEKITMDIQIKNGKTDDIKTCFSDITSNNFVINFIKTDYLPW